MSGTRITDAEWRQLSTRMDLSKAVVSKSVKECLAGAEKPKRAAYSYQAKEGVPFVWTGGNLIRATIICVPRSKPRMTKFTDRQKTGLVRYREFRDLLKDAIPNPPPAGIVTAVNWTAYFEPPKSWNKKRRLEAIGKIHRSKPDRDNIDKAILDSLWPGGDSAIGPGKIDKRWDLHARLELEVFIEVP